MDSVCGDEIHRFQLREERTEERPHRRARKAVREAGLRFGVYYSGGLDWRFTTEPIRYPEDLSYIRPNTYEYADYAYKQVMELVDLYLPDVLWNDMGWPDKGKEDLKYLFTYYYNKHSEGAVNDRWGLPHWDFKTAEYHVNYPGICRATNGSSQGE